MSGMFAVTFSIVFAYVADITTKEDRSAAYGLVSSMAVIRSICIMEISVCLLVMLPS